MMNGKVIPYLSFFKRYTIQYGIVGAIVFLLFVSLSIIPVVSGFHMGVVMENNELLFSSQIQCCIFLLIGYGVGATFNQFGIAMSIKADRKNYLKALVIIGIGVSGIVALVGTLLEKFCVYLLEYLTTYDVILTNQTARFISVFGEELSLTLPPFEVSGIVVGFFTCMLSISFGFLLGALVYRLKKLTSMILFIGTPVLVVGFILSQAALNEEKFLSVLKPGVKNLLTLMTNPFFLSVVKVIGILVCIGLTVGLLRKAPIKEYAQDLI